MSTPVVRPSETLFVHNMRRYVAASFLLIGIASMISVVAATPVTDNDAAVYAMFVVLIVLTITTLLLQKTPYLLLTTTVAATAIASIWLSAPATDGEQFPLSARWLLHACIVAGLVLTTRLAVATVLPAAVIAFISMYIMSGSDPPWAIIAGILVICIHAFGLSMANNAAATVWKRAAQRRDAAVDDMIAAEEAAATADADVHARYLLRIRLHDTVLNCFRAIRPGPGPGSLPADIVVQQASECLRELDASAPSIDNPDADAAEKLHDYLRDEATRLNVDVTFITREPATAALPIPDRAYYGMQACARAALLNVAAHSDTRKATVTITETDTSIHVTVTDAGKGFTPRPGGPMSVERRALHFGVDSVTDSIPGRGTTVAITWSPAVRARSHSHTTARRQMVNGSLTLGIRRLTAWIGGTYFVETLLQPGFTPASPAFFSLFITGVVVTILIVRRNPYPLPWAGTIIATLAVPIVIILGVNDYGICTSRAETYIASGMAMLIIISSMPIAPTWLRALIPVAAYVTANGAIAVVALSDSPECGAVVTGIYLADMVVIGALAAVAVTFQRFITTWQASQEKEVQAVEEELAARDHAARISDDLSNALLASRKILTTIATKAAAISDPELGAALGFESRRLRNLLNIDDVEIGHLAAPLRDLVNMAYRNEQAIHIAVIPGHWLTGMQPNQHTADTAVAFLKTVLAHLPPHTESQLTVTPADTHPLHIVITGATPEHLSAPHPVHIDVFHDAGQTELALTWPYEN